MRNRKAARSQQAGDLPFRFTTPAVKRESHTIQVVMAPELTSKPDWQTLSVTGTNAQGKKIHLSVQQPIFRSRNITPRIPMTDRGTQILGGMENPKGDGVTRHFLTITLLDASGHLLADNAGDPPPLAIGNFNGYRLRRPSGSPRRGE